MINKYLMYKTGLFGIVLYKTLIAVSIHIVFKQQFHTHTKKNEQNFI